MLEPFVDKNFLSRYSRQIFLPDFLLEGQRKLRKSRAAIVGLGGLGCMIAGQLAAAGIGELILIDHDDVQISNLPRQWIYTEKDIGRKKVDIAKEWIQRMRSDILVETKKEKLDENNAKDLIVGCLVVLDAVDNPKDKLIINDFALRHKVPLVYGGAVQYEGAFMTIVPGETHCLRCYFPDMIDEGQNCATLGVSSSLCSVIASFQVNEAIALLADISSVGRGNYHFFDLRRYFLKTISPNALNIAHGVDRVCPHC